MLKIKSLSLSIIVCYLFFACKSKDADSEVINTIEDTTVYTLKNLKLPTLSPTAKTVLDNWPIFLEFEKEMASLQPNTLSGLKTKIEKLLVQTDSIGKNIPDTLKANAIFSRLTIVKTRIGLLKQEVARGKTRPEIIQENLIETNKAVNNLIVQINEKFDKDKIDIERKDNEEKELEKQKKARDSIFKLELKDQNKKL